VLPIREKDLLALIVSKFCLSHIRIGEIARLKSGVAKVGISQVRPHESGFAEK
jgi:hypothetical protein